MKPVTLDWKEVTGETKLMELERDILSSVKEEQKLDLDAGGAEDNEVINTSAYLSRFLLDTEIDSEQYILMDLGIIGSIRKVKFVLNGVEVGQTNSRETESAYLVQGKLLKKENSLLAVIIDGSPAPIWLKGVGRIDYLPPDYKGEEKVLPTKVRFEELCSLPKIEEVYQEENRIWLTGDGQKMLLELWENGIFRLRHYQEGKEPLINSLCLDLDLIPETNIQVEKKETEIIISSGKIRIFLQRNPFALVVYQNGKRLFYQMSQPLMGRKNCGFQVALNEEEDIYGLGENAFPSMNKRGAREDIWVSHDWLYCDIPVPYYISSNGYGLYLNNSHHSFFDMGAMEKYKACIWALGGELDYFLIPGRNPKEILVGYMKITGRSKLPPRWAFGFFQSKTGKDSTEMIREKIERFKENEIPLDVISIDPDWENEFNDMQWNRNSFPSTEAFMELLKENHKHLMLWSSPFVTQRCSNYCEGKDKGFFLKNIDGTCLSALWWKDSASGIVDFTKKEACEWWLSQMEKRLKEGVDVFKIDGGDGGEVPVYAVNAEGISGSEFHNLYPVYYAKAVYEGIRRLCPGRRSMVWERTGFVGSGRYPCTWGGDQPADFTGTQVLLKGGQQAGLAGIFFWAPDVGGFGESCHTSTEFFIRSYEWGALAPLSRGHGNKTEPYEYGVEACRIVKKYIQLRYRLLPYLYSMAFQAIQQSVPMMRAAFLEYPEDLQCRHLDYQYFLGDFLMLAPIYEAGGNEDMSADRKIYFPDFFTDYWTGQEYQGENWSGYHASIETLPLFVKKGAIIPMLEPIMNTDEYTGDKYELHLYPSEEISRFSLYYDDGVTLDYEKGIYDEIEIECVKKADGIHLHFATLSNEMPVSSIQFQIWVHEKGGVQCLGRITYKKDNFRILL